MWLSNRSTRETGAETLAQLGIVTIGSSPAGVHLAGERRNVPVIAPAGYHWIPKKQDIVLVVKSGQEEEPCLLGKSHAKPERALLPGEVWISISPGSGIHLRADGVLDLVGDIYFNGAPLQVAPPEGE